MARRPGRSVLNARTGAGLALLGLCVGAAPPAPLELETLEGEPVALAPASERALVVHFWATWCPSCVDELPALAEARAACAGAVEIAVVDVGEDAEEIRRFLSERGVALDSLRDPDARVWRASVGARGLPANLVWTADGERRSELGPRTPQKWRELLGGLGCPGIPAPDAGR